MEPRRPTEDGFIIVSYIEVEELAHRVGRALDHLPETWRQVVADDVRRGAYAAERAGLGDFAGRAEQGLVRESPQHQIDVRLPPRQYDLAASILAAAVERSMERDEDVGAALREVAHERGRTAASEGPETDDAAEALWATLRQQGYEPQREGGDILLRNYPFHVVAQEFTSVACGMNTAFCEGLADALDLARSGFRPQFQPSEGWCCVAFEPAV